jgi:membrane protein YdbS with pleckstrin-like domain
MTNGRSRPRTAVIVLIIVAVLLLLSGVVGILGGGVQAQAGWWMVAVALIGLVLVAIELARR